MAEKSDKGILSGEIHSIILFYRSKLDNRKNCIIQGIPKSLELIPLELQ